MKLTSQIVASLLPLAAMAQVERPMNLVESGGGHHAAGSQIDQPALQVAPERDPVRGTLMVLAPRPELSVASPVRELDRTSNTEVAPAFATAPGTSAAAAGAVTRLPPGAPVLIAQAGAAAVTSPVLPTAPTAARPAAPASAAAAVASAPAPSAKAKAAPAAASTPRPRDAAFFEEQEYRLRALKRLRDIGLISEDEYVQKRREVLGQL